MPKTKIPSVPNTGLLATRVQVYHEGMEIVSLAEYKAHLSEHLAAVERTGQRLLVTRHGVPSVVVVGADEWGSIEETLFWQAQPGLAEDLTEAAADAATGRALGEDELRAKFDIPKRR